MVALGAFVGEFFNKKQLTTHDAAPPRFKAQSVEPARPLDDRVPVDALPVGAPDSMQSATGRDVPSLGRPLPVINYTLSPEEYGRFCLISSAIAKLKEAEWVRFSWYYKGEGSTTNRWPVHIRCNQGSGESDAPVWGIEVDDVFDFYFYPEGIYVFAGNKGTVVEPNVMNYVLIRAKVSICEQRIYLEDATDTVEIVRREHMYLRLDGHPDMRHSYNPMVPVARIGVIEIAINEQHIMLLEVSSKAIALEAGSQLAQALSLPTDGETP